MRKKTKYLDLRNQIYCMDCMELMAHIPDNFVSLILTDPPYGIAYQNHFARQPHEILDGDQGIDYERFAWESYRILRDNSHAYFFTRFDCYSFHYDCLRKAGFTVKNCLVVEKGTLGGIGDLKGSYANNSEWIIFVRKDGDCFSRHNYWRTVKKKAHSSIKAENQVRNTRRGSLPAGLARNTPRQPTMPHGRRNMAFTIQP